MRSRSSGEVKGSAPRDPVADVLHDLRSSEAFYCRCELRAPWGIEIPERAFASFHYVAEGTCHLRNRGNETRLDAGDFVLLPHGHGHVIAHAAGGAAVRYDTLAYELVGQNAAILRYGGDGPRAVVICGAVRFEHRELHPLVDLLPEEIITMGAAPGAASPRKGSHHGPRTTTLEALDGEALAPGPGTADVMRRLAEIVVIQTIRSWLSEATHDVPNLSGWLGALRDPQIGAVLARIHRRPEERWTVESLARAAHMSRSVFSERFTELVGTPPVQYLTRWRMHVASLWLHGGKLALGEVAARVGYDSEPSFSRAFKRYRGLSPGLARRAP